MLDPANEGKEGQGPMDSMTKKVKPYQIIIGKGLFNFIDTPGFKDTRGKD